MAVSTTNVRGSGVIAASDFYEVKWTGKTKSGKSIEIKMAKAICTSNIELAFAEKDDTVAALEFEGCYSDTALAAGTRTEPWSIKIIGDTTAPIDSILLGAGKFTINNVDVALTRGGGSFKVEREYREINADGDPGLVEGRYVQEAGRPKLSLNALTFLTNMTNIYPALEVFTTT